MDDRTPKAMLSQIVIGSGAGFWNTMPTRERKRSRSRIVGEQRIAKR
jgi:hypothetical protein